MITFWPDIGVPCLSVSDTANLSGPPKYLVRLSARITISDGPTITVMSCAVAALNILSPE